MQDALEEKMRVRERKAAASTVLAPSTASAASNQQRGAGQAHRDQRWTDHGSTNASNVSGRDRWQGAGASDSAAGAGAEAGAGAGSTLRAEDAVVPESLDRKQARVWLRDVYRRVFNSEAHRRKSFFISQSSARAGGPVTRWLQEHPDAALTAIAQEAAEEAAREARAAGAVVLLLEAVEVGAEVRMALMVRYVRHTEGEVEPVERLLALRDAYSTTGADLLRRLDELSASADPAGLARGVRGVSWEDGLGPVSAAASELLGLLQARAAGQRGGGPVRLWASGNSLERLVADACAREHAEARAFLEDADAVRELFAGARFSVLRRRCPAARREDWTTVRGVARELARPGGAEDVCKALVHLRDLSRSARERAAVDDLLVALQDSTALTCAGIFDALFDSLEEVARLLSFSEDGVTDPGVVSRWLSADLRVREAAAAARLRFESARRASRLVGRLLGTARAEVQRVVRECAAPLWLRHAVATGQDASQDLALLESVATAEERRCILADLTRARGQGLSTSEPRALLRRPERVDLPALDKALVELLTLPLLPCRKWDGDDDARPRGLLRAADGLRDSVRAAGGCPSALLEPVMLLLSSTDWTAAYVYDKDFSRVLDALVPRIQKQPAVNGCVTYTMDHND